MFEVKVDIGKNIVETAKNSGAPLYGRESHWGMEIYELVDLKPEVTVTLIRPGYEITANPLFSLTMYADSENKNNMAVEKIQLQYRYIAKTHVDAKLFVETIVKQFNRGKWKRHIKNSCPAVSGRSNYLNESGEIVYNICGMDPFYSASLEEWKQLLRMSRSFEWEGDGISATLSASFSEDSRGLTYNVDLEFSDLAIDKRRSEAAQEKALSDGDKRGWKSTDDYNTGMAENRAKVKILEENAVRRGDRLVSRN